MDFNDLDNLSLKDLVIFDKAWSAVCYASLSFVPVSLTYALVSGDTNGFGAAGIGALTSFTGFQASVVAKGKIMVKKMEARSITKRHKKRNVNNKNS